MNTTLITDHRAIMKEIKTAKKHKKKCINQTTRKRQKLDIVKYMTNLKKWKSELKIDEERNVEEKNKWTGDIIKACLMDS